MNIAVPRPAGVLSSAMASGMSMVYVMPGQGGGSVRERRPRTCSMMPLEAVLAMPILKM